MLQAIGLLTMGPITPLMMPVLARLTKDLDAFRDQYVRLVTLCLVVWLPLAATLGVLAPVVVPAAFGPQWLGAVPVLQAMCLGCVTVPSAPSLGRRFRPLDGRSNRAARGGSGYPGGLRLSRCLALRHRRRRLRLGRGLGAAGSAASAHAAPNCGAGVGELVGDALRLALGGAGMVVAMLARSGCSAAIPSSRLRSARRHLVLIEFLLLPRYVSGMLRLAYAALPALGRVP